MVFMPTVSISLSDAGYEAYLRIPKGQRSFAVDRLLIDHYCERRDITDPIDGRISIKEHIARLRRHNEVLQQRIFELCAGDE